MASKIFLVLALGLCTSHAGTATCESGWMPYKDETCIKSFIDFLTYPEARMFCTTQGNNESTATLLMVKNVAMHEFVAAYTSSSFDNFWLGGKYDDDTTQFKWEDGEPLVYTNWGDGYPRPNPNSDVCIQLRPSKVTTTNLDAKWEDTACQRRGLVLCQRPARWSLEDTIRELFKMREELEVAQRELAELKQDHVAQVVPVGSIYIEYSNQASPTTLWPEFGWQDVTGFYSGLFFRALGGDSESWGEIQEDCAPRIRQASFSWDDESASGGDYVNFPANGVTAPIRAGWFYRHQEVYGNEMMRFDIQGCEVRPKNQAIRIWKRTN